MKFSSPWPRILCLFLWASNFHFSDAQQRNSAGNPVGELTPINVNSDACNKTVEIYTEVSSPPVTSENRFKPLLCHYRFRPFRTSLRDWVLRIRFTRFKVGRLVNDTHCENAFFQIIDGNGKSGINHRGREPGKFCGEIEQAQTFISETSSVRLVFSVDNYTEQSYFRFDSLAEQQYEVYLRYGQHPELYPNRRGEVPNSYCDRIFRDCRMQTCYVQSPAYPGIYPRNLHCRIKINTRQPFTKLHLQNEDFNVDGQRCENLMLCPMKAIGSTCPHDYLRIYDGKDEESPVIGTFCGMGKFPYDIIGTSADLFVEFVTAPAGPLLNTGFHFNVAHWPEHVDNTGERNGTGCDWIYRSTALAESGDKQGLFWSVSHWYIPNTGKALSLKLINDLRLTALLQWLSVCTYLMLGQPQEIVRLYFPSFRIDRIESPIQQWDEDCGESLTIYDAAWADDSKIIKTFCDTFSRPMEKQDFVSTGNALFVRFESKTGSYSGSSLYYWAHYDFFNNSHYGEPVTGTLCDETFSSWNQPSGKFASPLNTLIYKASTKPILCRYRFISTKRIFARVILNIVSINFKYNQDSCLNCWLDRVDKVTLLDTVKTSNASRICVCKESLNNQQLPINLISHAEEAEVNLRIDHRHALSNYFKYNLPIFEGTYQFIHGPLCGLTELGPTSDGKLKFPFYYNPTLRDQPVSCLWELRVHPEKDVWVHFKLLFSSSAKSCGDAKLEFYLPTAPATSTGQHFHQLQPTAPHRQNQPLLTLCGDASMGDRKTEISSQLPILSAQRLQQGGPLTIRLDAAAASKVTFLISWTELVQLPRNPDGSLGSRLEQKEDGFLCPGPEGVIIDSELVCNGVVNCPVSNGTTDPHDESDLKCKISSTRFLVLNVSLNVSWVTAALAGGGGALLFCLCCVLCCRCCRKKDAELIEY